MVCECQARRAARWNATMTMTSFQAMICTHLLFLNRELFVFERNLCKTLSRTRDMLLVFRWCRCRCTSRTCKGCARCFTVYFESGICINTLDSDVFAALNAEKYKNRFALGARLACHGWHTYTSSVLHWVHSQVWYRAQLDTCSWYIYSRMSIAAVYDMVSHALRSSCTARKTN